MFYRNFLYITFFILLTNCTTGILNKDKVKEKIVNGYSNKGFALVYSEELYEQKIISKKIDKRSFIIFQKNLKINTQVKIVNIINGKSIIATVGSDSIYPSFNNAVLSIRVAQELDININQPYIEIFEILENSIFIVQKAKTYDEERSVAIKAPVNNISINDLNVTKKKKNKSPDLKFSYTIKIADFYFEKSALMMLNRIKVESTIKNSKIKKFSDKKYRVYLGPFNDINSLQNSYNDISILQFENIEIIKND